MFELPEASEEDPSPSYTDRFLMILQNLLREDKDVFGLSGNEPVFLETLVTFLLELKDRLKSADFFT